MAGLERDAHAVHVADALERVVEPAVGHCGREMLLQRRRLAVGADGQRFRVHKLGAAERARELKLVRVRVDADHFRGARLARAERHAETHAAESPETTGLPFSTYEHQFLALPPLEHKLNIMDTNKQLTHRDLTQLKKMNTRRLDIVNKKRMNALNTESW